MLWLLLWAARKYEDFDYSVSNFQKKKTIHYIITNKGEKNEIRQKQNQNKKLRK